MVRTADIVHQRPRAKDAKIEEQAIDKALLGIAEKSAGDCRHERQVKNDVKTKPRHGQHVEAIEDKNTLVESQHPQVWQYAAPTIGKQEKTEHGQANAQGEAGQDSHNNSPVWY